MDWSLTGIDLLKRLLAFDYTKRITVDEALQSEYFSVVKEEEVEIVHDGLVERFECKNSMKTIRGTKCVLIILLIFVCRTHRQRNPCPQRRFENRV